MQWKKLVNDNVKFKDGGNIPCILAETKADLLEEKEENDKIYDWTDYKYIKEEDLKNFLVENDIDGYCKTSAKTGKNINEAVEFVIKKIIKRTKDCEEKGQEFSEERKFIILMPEKSGEQKTKGDNEYTKNNITKDDDDYDPKYFFHVFSNA